jgi:hypothetical protein
MGVDTTVDLPEMTGKIQRPLSRGGNAQSAAQPILMSNRPVKRAAQWNPRSTAI